MTCNWDMCVCVFQCQPTALLHASGSTQGGFMALGMVYFQTTHCLGRPHYMWDEYLYSVQVKVEVRVTVSVTVCVVLLCCVGWWWWKEGRRWNPVPAHSLLFSKSTKGAARLNPHPMDESLSTVLYAFSTYIGYCRRVWNLMQACDAQSSDQKVYISTPPSPEAENFQMKIYYPAGDRTPDLLNQRQTCYHLSQRGEPNNWDILTLIYTTGNVMVVTMCIITR